MGIRMTDTLDAFQEHLDAMKQLYEDERDKNERAERIFTAASGGTVEPAKFVRDVAPGYDGHIRELAEEVVFSVWNVAQRPATLHEVYYGCTVTVDSETKERERVKGVRDKVGEELLLNEWP